MLAGARRLDRGVEREQVRLRADLLDEIDERGDRLREPGQLLHLLGRHAHHFAHVEQRLARRFHVGAVRRRELADLLAQLHHAGRRLGVPFGDVPEAREHRVRALHAFHLMFRAAGHFHHCRRDLPAARGELLTHGGEVAGAVPDLTRFLNDRADQIPKASGHVVHRPRELLQFRRHALETKRPQVAAAEAVGGPDQFGERRFDRTHREHARAQAEYQRHEKQHPQRRAALGGLVLQIGGARHRAVVLRQHEGADVAQQRVRRRPGPVCPPARLLRPIQFRERVRERVGDLDLRLVRLDFVDDVPVRCRERPEAAVPALVAVRRIALFQHLQLERGRRTNHVLLRRAHLAGDGADEARAERLALEEQRQLLLHRLVERVHRLESEEEDQEDQAQQKHGAGQNTAAEASEHRFTESPEWRRPRRAPGRCRCWDSLRRRRRRRRSCQSRLRTAARRILPLRSRRGSPHVGCPRGR